MTRVVAVCNQKGGVGKSTTTYHLARAAVLHGLSVLAIDLDPQANLSLLLAAEDVDPEAVSIADVLSPSAGERLEEVTIAGLWPGLRLAPASSRTLARVRDELVTVPVGREARLRDALGGINDVDLVLIDCPPELGQLTINALVAAQTAVVVTEANLLAIQGVAEIRDTIATVSRHYNPTLQFGGVVVNKHEPSTLTGQERLAELRAAVPVLAVINKRAPIRDSSEAGVGLDEWPRDGAALAKLYDELLTTITEEDS